MFKVYVTLNLCYIYTFCQHVIEPGTPYYITVTAGTTGGNGKEKDITFFTKEQGS